MKRILITGCQRSGTTLMGLIMDSHPFISNVDEANFNSIDDLSSSLNSCAKLPQESANLNFIKNVFKPDSVIWMIRNPYDVIKSMVSLQISRGRSRTESWGSTYSHVEISKMLQYLPSDYLTPYQDLLGQYRATLSNMLVRSSDQGNIISCITCWVLKQECYRYLLDSGLDVVVVRYEDLVSSPSSVLPKLFKRLGFDWHDDVLRHHELHAGMSIGNTNNSRAIDLDSLFYSNNFFSDTELTLISKLTSSALLDFRYPVITSNTDFKSGMKSSMNDNFTPSWLVYGLSCAVNQERSRDFFVLISQLTTDDSKHSASVIDQVCETLFDEWSIKKLSSDSFLGLTGKLSKYIGAISLEKQRKLVSLLESHSPQWKILSAFQKKSAPQIDYIGLYEKNGAAHADVAHALVFLIGHFGSSENIHAQWSCLMQLIKQFPDLKYAKDVATALVNTLPSDINGSSVLLSWLSDELSKQELHKIFYKFIHKSSVDINGLNTKDFTINSYSDAYIAWRLGNTLLLEEHSLTQTTTSDFAGVLKSSQFQPVDFEGGASIYVGPDKPRKLVVCFTGFGSMLMHPLSLIHAVIDIDDDVGVLWLQDLHSKVFLAGEDGLGNIYSYEKYIVQIIEQFGAETVSVIASSGACYTALYLSSVYPIYRCVALSPYTYLAEGKDQDLLQRKFGPLFKGNTDVVMDMGDMEPEIRSYYGEKNMNDKLQSEHLLLRGNVELIPVTDMASHDIGDALIERGYYKDMFSWMTETPII